MKLPPLENGDYVRERIRCKDGFTLSVQASNSHYCKPEIVDSDDEYTHFEVGYPSEEESLLLPYKGEDIDHYCIYPFVPKEIIEQIIEKHGGLVD